MIAKIKIVLIIAGAFLLISCNEQNEKPKTTTSYVEPSLIPVQQSTVGDINVVVYNTRKDLKQGEGSFVIEFHKTKEDVNAKVANVNLEAVTKIDNKTIKGETVLTPTDTSGRYNVKYNLSDKGLWYFNVGFNDSLKVQFILSVI